MTALNPVTDLAGARERISKRGFSPAYRDGDRCPGCSRSNWYIGRSLAECAFCSTALPIEGRVMAALPVGRGL